MFYVTFFSTWLSSVSSDSTSENRTDRRLQKMSSRWGRVHSPRLSGRVSLDGPQVKGNETTVVLQVLGDMLLWSTSTGEFVDKVTQQMWFQCCAELGSFS